MRLHAKSMIALATVLAGVLLVFFAVRPRPVRVELGTVGIGPLQVTVEEQGETRSRDRYVVAAPVAGRLLRIGLREGDPVAPDEVVATIAPMPLAPRERDELTAHVAGAESALRARRAELAHTLADLAQARRERARLERLGTEGIASRQRIEQGRNAETTLEQDVDIARHRALAAEADLRAARAGLIALPGPRSRRSPSVEVRSPAAGEVLRILEPSERVVAAGTPILVVGDLKHLEVVMEMLSSEAVNVTPGMPATIEGWGGGRTLPARVQRVEPSGFTKVSALGVEEQRTNVILDFIDGSARLGDGFRVTGRIVLWQSRRVLIAPLPALFRCGSAWCAFVAGGGRARRHRITIGHRNSSEAEILSGLRDGERVVLYPPNDLADGSRIRTR